jgi:hypothetical protein
MMTYVAINVREFNEYAEALVNNSSTAVHIGQRYGIDK